MPNQIRVHLDVTLFGHVQEVLHIGHARAGIYRVVEQTARSLDAVPDVALTLSAAHSPEAAYAHVRAHRELRGVRFAIPGRKRLGHQLNQRVVRAYSARGAHPPIMLPTRAANTVLHVANRVLDVSAAGMDGVVRIDLPLRPRPDVFHSPSHPLPDRRARTKGTRCFITVHDVIPLIHPEFCSWGGLKWLHLVLESIGPEDRVLAVSESTRRDLLAARPDIAPDRVRVAHLAADRERFYRCDDPTRVASVRTKYGIPDAPYVLSVGTLEPRKNLPHLLRSFAAAVRQERLRDLHLVLTGDRGWNYDAIFASADQLGDLRDRVIFAGYVDDADLAPLYTGALMFAYPSLYEGFGLPPLEAMQCGAPVIASNTSSLPEVVGDAGILVDPRDPDALAHAIVQVYRDGALRERLVRQSSARAATFTWARYADQLVAAYRDSL